MKQAKLQFNKNMYPKTLHNCYYFGYLAIFPVGKIPNLSFLQR